MTAVIIPFPINKHVYFVRETARALERKSGEAADRFWRLTCRRLFAQLQLQGLSESAIRNELQAFSNSVRAEMERAACATCEASNPKGAA